VSVAEGSLLWEPSDDRRSRANLTSFVDWLAAKRGQHFDDYEQLWDWSVEEPDVFWRSVALYFEVARSPRSVEVVLESNAMPFAKWFPHLRLNFAELATRQQNLQPALIARSEIRPDITMSRRDLAEKVRRAASWLHSIGVEAGDRVAAILPNIPEAVIAFLATASLGAVWSCCSPETGAAAIASRFKQIEPKVLIGTDGYRYRGVDHDRRSSIAEVIQQLPGLEAYVHVPYGGSGAPQTSAALNSEWAALMEAFPESDPLQVPFDHPLWIVYSSGTTGPPKALVHGHGGISLELLKLHSLHSDLGPRDRFFWHTTTGWAMWNILMGGLLVGATVVIFDGDPMYPNPGTLWQLATDTSITYFGASAPYFDALRQKGYSPRRFHDLSGLRSVGSTGSSLSPESFAWIYENVHSDVLVASISGGTDVCTAFIASCPWHPVLAGELQCLALGANIAALDAAGTPVTDAVGELVLLDPLPSMPLYLWGDTGGGLYKESYFADSEKYWRHGDWVKITSRGSAVIYGRSDATLNRGGIRVGTSEYYRVVEAIEGISDSLIIDTGGMGRESRLLLFVVLAGTQVLTRAMMDHIKTECRNHLSPRHVPDLIVQIDEVPRTHSGKKLEVPVKRILTGTAFIDAVQVDAVANPSSLDFLRNPAPEIRSGSG
jgi:acetoacetyl-CoA synthetase